LWAQELPAAGSGACFLHRLDQGTGLGNSPSSGEITTELKIVFWLLYPEAQNIGGIFRAWDETSPVVYTSSSYQNITGCLHIIEIIDS